MCGLKSSIEPDVFPYPTTKAHSELQSAFAGQIPFFAVMFPLREHTTTPIYHISPSRFLRSCHRNPPAPCPHPWWSRRRFQWSMLSWSSLPAQQPAAAGRAMPRSRRISGPVGWNLQDSPYENETNLWEWSRSQPLSWNWVYHHHISCPMTG